MTIRVVVADDHGAVRAGLVLVLAAAPDITVVGEASDGLEVIDLVRRVSPDVVVMDIRMPGCDGIAATRQLSQIAEVLILTTFDLDEYVYGALRAGAAGFLLKDTDADSLLAGVRLVAKGDGLISPQITRRLIRAFSAAAPPVEAPPALHSLTSREREVLEQLAAGLSNREIAAVLGMAPATTKAHVSRILTKLGLRSRVHAAVLARELGIYTEPPDS